MDVHKGRTVVGLLIHLTASPHSITHLASSSRLALLSTTRLSAKLLRSVSISSSSSITR